MSRRCGEYRDRPNKSCATRACLGAATKSEPVIISSASLSGTEDIEYTYQVEVEDPDDSIFLYTLVQSPDGMSISDTGLISWVPLEGVTSSGLVTLSVEDGYDEALSGGELNDPESPVNVAST